MTSFTTSVSTASIDDLYRSTIVWVEQHCSLVDLRPGLFFFYIYVTSNNNNKNYETYCQVTIEFANKYIIKRLNVEEIHFLLIEWPLHREIGTLSKK